MSYAKGYRSERKVRLTLEKHGWNVVRAGRSLGVADLICLRKGRCVLLQIKATKSKRIYYDGYMKTTFQGFPFYLVVDFGYGRIRITEPKAKLSVYDGDDLEKFAK